MKKLNFKQYLVAGVAFSMLLFSGNATANTWQEFHAMTPAELNHKIEQLQLENDNDGNDFEKLKKLGIAYHIKAIDNKKSYAPKAVECLTKAREIDNSDFEVLCYLGSATTMLAKTTINPIKKMSYVNKGTSYMDKAVNLAPDNVTIRMTRALNSMQLPGFLNRKGFAIIDFEYLNQMVEKDPQNFPSISTHVYQNLAELYQKKGDEEKAEYYQNKLQP